MGKIRRKINYFDMESTMNNYNYYFENGLAFTDDRITVHNIFLYKISKQVQRDDVKKYFEKFGEITNFRFVVKKATGRRRGSRVGFIHYKEAKAAAKALAVNTHNIDGSKVVSVKACDTWHQPGGNFVDSNDQSCSKVAAEIKYKRKGQNITIQDLDDDCLLLIFKTMTLRAQILFACSHERFKTVFQIYAKLHYKSFRAEQLENLSLWNIRQFFIFAGHCIETFTGRFQHKDRERIFSFINVHCSSLLKLKLDSTKVKLTTLHKLLSNKPKLTTLNLNNCEVKDHSIYAIKKLMNLDNLIITRSCEFTGQFLNSLKRLKMLRLLHCCNLQPSHLQKALAAMPNLRFLDIRGSERFSNQAFENLPNLAKNLETIQISCINAAYENVAKIPKLKNLSLLCYSPIPLRIELFRQLAKEKWNQLESLQIVANPHIDLQHCQYISKLKLLKKLHLPTNLGITDQCLSVLAELSNLEEVKLNGCSNITNSGILEMVCRCKKLKNVNIQNTDISNEFVVNILNHLKENKRLNGRMIFLVANTRINEYKLPAEYKSPELQEKITFVFKYPKLAESYDNLDDAFETNDCMNPLPFFHNSVSSESDDYDYEDDDDTEWRVLDMLFDDLDDDLGFRLGLEGNDIEFLM